jgi:hypothetical protein
MVRENQASWPRKDLWRNYCRANCSERRARGEVTIYTRGKTKALAKSEVHQWSRAWMTNGGWSSSLISKTWRTVMNSEHWLVKFKICIITTAWRQRNSKHFLIWWFLAKLIYFISARLCKFQKLFKKIKAKEGSKDADVNEDRFVFNIDVLFAL